ncbi:hexamerin-like isoform X2 [Venturia canescens]|uniref:hexamerin-like isoform X2 n=1 Tax=Venturia canescens TaxID=32260 RepID=UPI001C9C79A3|nr:hexamerin-like isoform X2 [Venturia canescens]
MRSGYILLALVAATVASPVYQRAADQDLLKKQQDTIYLLEHIWQDLPNQELYNLGYHYDIESNVQYYHEPQTALYYYGMFKAGHLQPKGTVYSNSVSQLRKEVALLTRVFLAAKDYPVFLQTAAWARVYVNEGQFVKAYIAAIFQREDTVGVIPPPLYEIFPQHYVDSRIIHEAQHIYAEGYETEKTVYIPVNYTDYLPFGEQQLSYFTHDIGLNAYYAYVSLAGYMIPEVHGSDYEKGHHIGHGSYYYYLHQQLLARYNLNRLGSGLGPIDSVDFENVKAAYKPHLHFANGLEYPSRPNELYLTPYHQDLVKNVYAFEKRLMNAIDSGYVITPQQQFLSLYQPQGLNILGDIIEGTGRSVNPRYYGSLQAVARQLLGNTPEFYDIWSYTPSALEQNESAVRDPAFYQLYKRIIKLFQRYQQSLPAYQYNDLVVPGVKIEKVVFPNLVTYFDQYNVDLDNGYVHSVKEQHHDYHIKAQFHRLNHQPYEYQVVVQSEKPYTNAVVRVYLGPKFDYDGQPIDINHHRHYFVELDHFVHDLKEGENVIVRHSQQAPIFSHDYPSVHQIKVHLDSALRSQNPFYITEPQHIFGFPARLALPKGTYGGLPLQVFVIVSANEEYHVPYGPVIPAEFQTYQHHQYQIVDGEHYEQYSQPGFHQPQQGVYHGGYQTLEVLPHYESNGIYGNQVNKFQAYYGHYLYKKYPHQYPVFHYPQHYQHYQHYQHGVEHGQQYQHSGVYQHQGVYGYGQQPHYAGHQQGVGEQYQGQYVHQGQVHHGQVHQGQVHQGQVHQGQAHQGQYYEQGHQYSQVHDVPQEHIEGGKHHGIYQGQVGGHHVSGVYPSGVPSDIVGGQNIVGGQTFHGAGEEYYKQGHYPRSEYLKNYYGKKHISHIIGGALSLDNKPLGYPLERPLGPSAFYVPNIHVTDVIVHHVDYPIEGGVY